MSGDFTVVGRILAQIQAEGEINNVPPVQLAAILAKAKKEMSGR